MLNVSSRARFAIVLLAFALAFAAVLAPLPARADDPSLQEDPAAALTVQASDTFELSGLTHPQMYLDAFKGQFPPSGILKGWGNYLYYLPETPSDGDGAQFTFNMFERYNIATDTWETLTGLPVRLVYCSATFYSGNLVVAGVEFDTAAGEPTTTERIYMFDPDSDAWYELDAAGVNLGASIVNRNGQLMLVGGADGSWHLTRDVMAYDTASGRGGRIASLATAAFCPQLAVADGLVYVYSYGVSYAEFTGGDVASQTLQVIEDDWTEVLWNAFPRFLERAVPAGMPSRSVMFGSLVAANEGLVLTGPLSADGATDTFIRSWDDDAAFEPYHLRADAAPIYGAASCLHGDRYYVAASSDYTPGHALFSATASLLAPQVLEGDGQVWRKGSQKPLAVSFTPDFNRYFDEVSVDAADAVLDDDCYEAKAGSTVVMLRPAYLEGLPVGEHALTVRFDGAGAQVVAHFTIEEAASPMPAPADGSSPGGSAKPGGARTGGVFSGYTRPAALALTGDADAALLVPFAVIAVCAVGLGVYLILRRRRG